MVRVVGLVSFVVVSIGWGFVEGAVLALVLGGLMLPRMLGVRATFDIAVGVTLLLAAWSSVLGLYVTVPWVDIPAHLVLTGLLAALAVLLLRHIGLPLGEGSAHPAAESALVTASFGALLSVLWELGEWAGHTFVDSSIYVGYDDTVGDLVIGTVGSAVAGLLLPWLTADRRVAAASSAESDESTQRIR